MLLGVTGDQVLPADIYQDIKVKTLKHVSSWNSFKRYFEKKIKHKIPVFSQLRFALRLMGDVQEYFIKQNVRNFYSVSFQVIILLKQERIQSQLAFTLANGFYLCRILFKSRNEHQRFRSEFIILFSNGIDPEYAVIGRGT